MTIRRFGTAGIALFAVAGALACRSEPEPARVPDPASRRELREGAVVGFSHPDGGHAWLGIPFAQPPAGDLRWRAPRPPAAWQGTREALEFAPPCPQLAGPGGGRDGAHAGEPTGSEDCLYLNVFAPRFAPEHVPNGAAALPVMVWIHGGGNTIGDTRLYDAARLAKRGTVVVALQYRLGVLGWFSHPALRAGDASPDDASGNYGTLDLIQGLEWVRENAAAFGGDPGRVTVFGESAGGLNVFGLLLSPRAEGLFQRAIAQSGGLWFSTQAEAENFADDAEPGDRYSSREILLELLIRDGRAKDREAARAALAAMSGDEAEYLRGQPASALLDVFEDVGFGMYDAPDLIRDGRVLPREEPLEALRAGAYHRVPVVLGSTRDENKTFMAGASPHVRRLGRFPLGFKDERRYELEAEYASRMWKATGVDEPAAAMRAVQGETVFAYRFDWDAEPSFLWVDLSRLLGAGHGLDVPFVFGRLSLFGMDFLFDEDHREQDLALAHAIQSYWVQFAATGAPGRGQDGDLPLWEAWAAGRGHKYALLDTEDDGGIHMGSEPTSRTDLIARVASDPRFESNAERCAVWAGFVRWKSMPREEYARAAGGACAEHPIEARD